MSISGFFNDVLAAKLTNVQWSWGAVQKKTGRIILRVWDDEIDRKRSPNEVQVQAEAWSNTSAGWKERQRHIDSMDGGAEAFAVVCHKGRKAGERTRIGSFDPEILLRLGETVRRGGDLYVRIDGRVPASEVIPDRDPRKPFADEVAALRRAGAKEKLIDAFIKLRIGQGLFRADLLRIWHHRCCVTGSRTLRAIRASHIKSWRRSTKKECRDPRNGLPLIATLDALFDAGLISFSGDGQMLISSQLGHAERELLGLDDTRLARPPHAETARFLKWHRANTFKK